MNIPNKHSTIEARAVVSALDVKDIETAEKVAQRAFREMRRAAADLSRMDRSGKLLDAFGEALRRGGPMMDQSFSTAMRHLHNEAIRLEKQARHTSNLRP